MTTPNPLASLPPGVTEALGVIDGLDAGLLHGFSRLADDHRAGLDRLRGALDGSPLGPAVNEAVAAIGRSEFVPRSFLILAGARAALLGAVHDALRAQLDTVLKRASPAIEEASLRPAGSAATVLGSAQHWLMELAIAGFRHLDEGTVAPFSATLENLQDHPELFGIAALLTGFVHELLRATPTARQAALPVFRWADLWSTALLETQGLPPTPAFREVSGRVIPLGLDVRSHDNVICATLYGILDGADPRTVRLPFCGYKVDVLADAEAWDLFEPHTEPLLTALAQHRAIELDKAELRGDGDVILRKAPKVAASVDPFELSGKLTALPAPRALMRHPVQIGEPVALPADHGLPVASERLPRQAPILTALEGAGDLIGLLRFDRGGWRVQPLCVRKKKGFLCSGEELAPARAKLKVHSLEILRERSGRLLRKS